VLHTAFDHARFARELRACLHRWLITDDDSPEVRRHFAFPGAHIYEWQLQYGMNNFGRSYAPKGRELFITNYKVAPQINSD
jgi:DNA adenine methylase